MNVDEISMIRGNEPYYYPAGRINYEPLEVQFYDLIGLNAFSFVHEHMYSHI